MDFTPIYKVEPLFKTAVDTGLGTFQELMIVLLLICGFFMVYFRKEIKLWWSKDECECDEYNWFDEEVFINKAEITKKFIKKHKLHKIGSGYFKLRKDGVFIGLSNKKLNNLLIKEKKNEVKNGRRSSCRI